MPVKVSVVVPVFNPGEHIDPLIGSLQAQSLPQAEFETIFVDDGSTDETPAKLDRLAEAQENVTVVHIPNSGWPGRPRNVGIDTAVGEYVQFVDHDDELGPEALERLYAYATENGSDVVVGKEVRRTGNWTIGPIFDRNRPRATLEDDPILGILTPHKMFRREFLNRHRIRFLEGPRRMEDHPFVVEAYFRAEVISVLSDYPVYYWNRRPDRGNAGARPFDWADYYVYMRDVLDVVERHTEPGDFRDRLLSFWYHSKGLGILAKGAGHKSREESRRHFDALRDLAAERFPPSVDKHLKGTMRIHSELLRAGDFEGMLAIGRLEHGMHVQQAVTDVQASDGRLLLGLRAGLAYEDGSPVTFDVVDGRYRWRPPIGLDIPASADVLDFTDPYDRKRVELVLRSRDTAEAFLVPARLSPREAGSGSAPLTFDAAFEIDPDTAAFGRPLDPGVHDLYLRLTCSPWRLLAPLPSPSEATARRPLTAALRTSRTVVAFTTPGGRVAVDVDQRTLPLLDVATPSTSRSRLVPREGGLAVVVPLDGLALSGGPVRGRLRLVPEAGGTARTAPLRITGEAHGERAVLRARIRTDRHDPGRGVGPGRWRLAAVVQGRRTDLGLALEVDRRGGAVLSTAEGQPVTRRPARGARLRRLAGPLRRSARGQGRPRVDRVPVPEERS